MAEPHFVAVASVSEIAPGQIRGVDVGATKLVICNYQGQIHVLDGVCSHARGPLCRGELDGRYLVCPWHGWEYDVETGQCEIEPTLSQKKFAVKIDGDTILVAVDSIPEE